MANQTDLNNIEESQLEEPSEVLENLLDELLVFAKDHDEHLVADWIPEEGLYQVVSDDLEPVDVLLVDIDDAMYGEAEALVVESEIGIIDGDVDPLELLRFCDENFVFSRLALASSDEGDLLVAQAACPVSQLTAAQFDAMIREVAVFSKKLLDSLNVE